MSKLANCKSCGAAIFWTKTANGKPMPVDGLASANGNVNVDDDGIAHYVGAGKGKYTSHFATCPNAKEHRKEEPKKQENGDAEKYRSFARHVLATAEVSIEKDAPVRPHTGSKAGAWVQAWVFVAKEDLE